MACEDAGLIFAAGGMSVFVLGFKVVSSIFGGSSVTVTWATLRVLSPHTFPSAVQNSWTASRGATDPNTRTMAPAWPGDTTEKAAGPGGLGMEHAGIVHLLADSEAT